jgi:hypothetical protein
MQLTQVVPEPPTQNTVGAALVELTSMLPTFDTWSKKSAILPTNELLMPNVVKIL